MMKKLRSILAIVALLAVSATATADVLLYEDFEDADVTYTTNVAEFTDGGGDFFIRTDGSNIGSYMSYNNVQGSSYFAVMDIDGDQSVEPVIMTFSGIDISGKTGIEFSALFAEDDDGTKQDWDALDYVHVQYSIDGGEMLDLLWFENDGTQYNTEAYVDADFDGNGEGAALTDTFESFVVGIDATGSVLDIQIVFQLDAGDEDIAIDDVTVTAVPEPATMALLALGGLVLRRKK